MFIRLEAKQSEANWRAYNKPMKTEDTGIKDFKTALSNKTVLVTGASRGIGKAIAIAFARQGARLAICGRDGERLKNTVSEIEAAGGTALSAVVDLLDEQAICQYLASLKKEMAPVQVLINNAGIYRTAAVDGHSSQVWREVLDTNLNAPFIFCRELIAQMVKSGWGRIINISSISGKSGEIYGAAYSASKFGLIGLTEALALELASTGVTVNALCPGWVKTDMAINQLSDPDYTQQMSVTALGKTDAAEAATRLEPMEIARLSVPQMRFIEAEEVADLALYLASDSARGITGQSINICGGMSI